MMDPADASISIISGVIKFCLFLCVNRNLHNLTIESNDKLHVVAIPQAILLPV